MANFILKNTKILGTSMVLGENEKIIDEQPEYYNHDEALLQRLKTMIGLHTRYVANEGTTTCDLCEQASLKLCHALDIPLASIEAVISVTQTPDYTLPGNAHVLHAKLQLPKTTLALDVGMGCSGFVYGLWLASMMVASGLKRVLLVAGDTLSKLAHTQDRTTAPLFGDAGTATIIDFSSTAAPMHFMLQSDGSQLESMYVPAGGSRTPSTEQTRIALPTEDGSVRSQENLFMDGFGIFKFTMTEQPLLLQNILAFAGKSKENVDYFILHQANKYIVETITQKSGIAASKVPSDTFSRFGNLNSASIVGVLCGTLSEELADRKVQAVLQGFGTGLSWGACQLELDNILCLKPERYKP